MPKQSPVVRIIEHAQYAADAMESGFNAPYQRGRLSAFKETLSWICDMSDAEVNAYLKAQKGAKFIHPLRWVAEYRSSGGSKT
jgi:hypothetical protein